MVAPPWFVPAPTGAPWGGGACSPPLVLLGTPAAVVALHSRVDGPPSAPLWSCAPPRVVGAPHEAMACPPQWLWVRDCRWGGRVFPDVDSTNKRIVILCGCSW